MSQPSPGAGGVLEDEAHGILMAQWPPTTSCPPYADHLRRFAKPESPVTVAVTHGPRDGWMVTATTTNSSATSATSRSPSPATPSESSQYYAASTSSWATSQAARSATDCGGTPGNDDERVPGRPLTPVTRFSRSIKGIAARSPSRPSSLRNAMSAGAVRDSHENDGVIRNGSEQGAETDLSEDSEEETAGEEESDTDNEDDNEWSGQNGNLESLLIEAVEGDLALAAYLVPVVHHEFQLALKSKVESWQCQATTTAHGSTESSPGGGKPSKGNQPSRGGQDGVGGNSRKRRRRSSSDGGVGGRDGPSGDGDDGDEDEDRDGRDHSDQSPPDGADSTTPTLACPFHKRDPIKYGIQSGNSAAGTKKHKYRGCIGPGYKSIQRLKEHLKRVHSPVQCDRCYEIFPGSLKERAACLAKLAEHRKMAVSCERGDVSKKEGIDEFQWAILDKQSRKKNQEAHRVEKWYEIWDVLFPEPGVKRPENPWNDITVQHHASQQSSTYGEESFAKLLVSMMEHKVRQMEIDAEVFESIRGPLASVARQALRAHINIRGAPSTETSSSESKNRPSLGSLTQLSAPATTTSHQVSVTTAATSMTAGSPVRGRAGTSSSNPYSLSSPQAAYHGGGMGLPMARQQHCHSQQPSQPQFTHMSPMVSQAGLGHQVAGSGNMAASFAGITAADDPAGNFYAFNYVFAAPPPPPPPHAQGHHPTASWAGAGSVPYPAPHAMPQNFGGLTGAEYYGDVGDYSQGGQDEV